MSERSSVVFTGAEPNPCLSCGACCAFFRASFYWAEADDATEGGVPAELTEKMSPQRLMMRGTNGPKPHCVALEGVVGELVRCAIYARRSSVCREFAASWQHGEANPRCDKARAAWGLAPLTPDTWHRPNRPRSPKAA